LFYQLTKAYSYEPQPLSHWFILRRFLYFEFHPVQCLSSNYQLKIFTAHIPCAFRKRLVNNTILWLTDRSINYHLARSIMNYLLYYTQCMQIYQTTCFCYCISNTKKATLTKTNKENKNVKYNIFIYNGFNLLLSFFEDINIPSTGILVYFTIHVHCLLPPLIRL
jgi:hypothetical protein